MFSLLTGATLPQRNNISPTQVRRLFADNSITVVAVGVSMSSHLLSMIVGAPSKWLRPSRLHAILATASSLGAGYLLLHSPNFHAVGAAALAGLSAALLGRRWGARTRRRASSGSPRVRPVTPPAEVGVSMASAAFLQSGAAMVVSDALDRITLVNDAFLLLTGLNRERIVGQPAELLGLQPLRPSHMPGVDEAIRQGDCWNGETTLTGPDGAHHDLWLTVSTARDPDKRISHHTRVFQNVEPLKAQLRQMADQARHDSLTGLANRRALGELMFQAMARTRRYTKTLAIMCVDLDGFKGVNDTHGHQVGDLLLMAVARRLEACVRTTDRACRMGGDEFMLILEGPGQMHEITRIGERVLQSIKEPFSLGDQEVCISSSIGVVIYDGRENDQGLLKRADDAMYAAKHAGKNRMVFVEAPQAKPMAVVAPRMVSQRA
jgi:diguanylate cyclase (GGDEF)-like protein/PAS domain S-box-containing protein